MKVKEKQSYGILVMPPRATQEIVTWDLHQQPVFYFQLMEIVFRGYLTGKKKWIIAINQEERKLLALPTKLGGLGIPMFSEISDTE